MSKIKKITTYFFISIGLVLFFIKSLIALHYTYIAPQTALINCINVNKPKLKCNGKCFIAKQINATQKNEKENNFQPAFPDQDYFIDATENFNIPCRYKKLISVNFIRLLPALIYKADKPPAA